MDKSRIFESAVGFLVLSLSVWFFFYAYNKTAWKSSAGYTICAKFDNADGLSPGTDVKIGGVKVGTIESISIDTKTYTANVYLKVDKTMNLPTDTEAIVASNGLLGGKYVQLVPGIDETILADNSVILRTRGAQNLESLIGQFLMSDKKN